MTTPLRELLDAIASRLCELIQLIEPGEIDWFEKASRLDHCALEEGLDLSLNYDSPQKWSASAVAALRFYIDAGQFPSGYLKEIESAEDLFWRILPNWRRTGL